MALSRKKFELAHAQKAVSDDGTTVEFVGRNELLYGFGGRWVMFFVETFVAPDGAPDGVVVGIDENLRWSDGTALKRDELATILSDLEDAGVPLLTKFRVSW